MKDLLLNYIKYSLWANERICKILQNNPSALDKEFISSFKTIRLTIYHMWDAETIWYKRLAGESLRTRPSESFLGTDAEFFKAFDEQSRKYITLLENMPGEKISGSCTYTTTEGKEHATKIADIIMQVMNHSTFHRGQIITLLRNAGVTELPSTDYITYIRQSS
jgi:uncharacterized damage-inducible protein DinB